MHQNKTSIPDNLVRDISAYAQSNGVPTEKLWLVTFQAFLHRLTQENRSLVAAPAQAGGAWGVFSVEFNPALRFSELIKQEPGLQAGNLSTQITFQFLDGINLPLPENLAPVLSLELTQAATWNFDPSHYSPEEIACIPQAFLHFAENMLRNPDQLCCQVSLLSPEQWAEMQAWNRTEADFPAEATLHELISVQAKLAPERIAAVYNGGQLTYAELERRANLLAYALIAAGLQPGQVVGLYMERSLNLLAAQLAILKAGAAFAALDLQYPPEMLARLFDNFELPFILTHSDLKSQLPKHKSGLLLIDQLLSQPNHPLTAPDLTVDSRSAAFIIFTSGSTGIPKGVIHTHRNLLARFQAAWTLAPMNADDVVSQTSPLSSIDAVDEIFSPFLLGARTVMIPHAIVTDPRRLVDLLEAEGVTRMVLVPALLRMILTAYEDLDRRLARLTTWLIGGEALTPTLVKSFYEKLPQASLINFYGLTEGDATYYPVVMSETPPPVGRPIQNTHVYVLDAQLQPVPPGLAGEICLSGEGLFKEYWNRPDLNAEKWLANPFSETPNGSFARLFKTGDLGRWQPDGQLQYLGRRDRMVKILSFRVELGEVEAALAANPIVKECAVRVWQTESTEEAVTYQPRLVAYVVLKESMQATPLQLREALKEHLPDYALPKQVILLDFLPSLPNGKVDYRSLPEPGEAEPVEAENFTEPANEFELYLVKLWEWLLKRHPISTQDNFFDLGGDSLLVILLITELEKELGQTLSLALLFHAPTIVQLATVLREKGWKPAWSSLVPIRPHGSRPPLFCVHADGGAFFYNRFTSHLSPDQPLYGIQARGLDGKQEPFTRVEEMAVHYISEIRSIQPKGPYLISGFSMGGVVIYEMAQQLLAVGETSLIIFLDAPSPSYPVIVGTASRGKLKRLMNLSMRDRIARLFHRLEQRRHWLRDELLSKLHLRLGRPLSPTLRIHRVRELNQKIADHYQPKPYSGPIIILRANEQPAGAQPDPSLGWSQYVNGPITDYVIAGDHESIFREPNVQKLAERLQLCIDEWLAAQTRLNISDAPITGNKSVVCSTPVDETQGH